MASARGKSKFRTVVTSGWTSLNKARTIAWMASLWLLTAGLALFLTKGLALRRLILLVQGHDYAKLQQSVHVIVRSWNMLLILTHRRITAFRLTGKINSCWKAVLAHIVNKILSQRGERQDVLSVTCSTFRCL